MITYYFVSGFMERRAPIVRYYRLRLCIKQTDAFQHVVYSGSARAFSHKISIIVKKTISVILSCITLRIKYQPILLLQGPVSSGSSESVTHECEHRQAGPILEHRIW
jgi:hypothetical protein